MQLACESVLRLALHHGPVSTFRSLEDSVTQIQNQYKS
jgi:hypothetical protein